MAIGQLTFTDQTIAAGLLPIEGAESIAVGDFNNDGYDDFYVCSIANKNQLYQNKGDGTFIEISDSLGVALDEDTYSQAAVWGDLNNDGWLDLYVANKAKADNVFINQGNGTFEDRSFWVGIYHLGFPKSVNLADINNDGWLDIYISNFYAENVMYLNNGDETFSNYTTVAGAFDTGKTMGTIFFDYDKDGDLDLYLVHDSFEPNLLYQNNGTGVFTEVGAVAGVNTESFGMGVDVGDINRDGWLDIYIANFGENFLLLNNGDGTFSDISTSSNTNDTGMGWGSVFLDFDNDGWEDIYVCNTHAIDFQQNALYRNLGDFNFEKAETNEVICNEYSSYGNASLDIDLDGNMDVLVANRGANESVQLFQNPERSQPWVSFKLIGTTSNRSAIGTTIQLTDDLGIIHYQELCAGQSWSSQNSSLLHIGLGDATGIAEIKVSWPSGLEEIVEVTRLHRFYTIIEYSDIYEGIIFDIPTSIQDLPYPTDMPFQLFPNPSNGHFTVAFYTKTSTPIELKIYNVLGELIFYKKMETTLIGKNEIIIDLHSAVRRQFVSVQLFSQNSFSTQSLIINP